VAKLPDLKVKINDDTQIFHGSWWRGDTVNFIPSKVNLRETNAVEKYVLPGWCPDEPFITKSKKIVAFGSCFAANISKYLSEKGYVVMGEELELDAHIIRFGEGMVNTFAILQQLDWAINKKEMPENIWFGAGKEIAAVDPSIRDQTSEIINNTDVFILTLGLSEIWYDKRNNEPLWRAVPAQLFDKKIHGFRVSSFQENFENLSSIRSLIREVKPHAPIIFTLSPIPLIATFRPISCITANSASKAILRAALDQLMREYDKDSNLFYFPSYEIITDFHPDPYIEDNRHPRGDLIHGIMELFEKYFCLP